MSDTAPAAGRIYVSRDKRDNPRRRVRVVSFNEERDKWECEELDRFDNRQKFYATTYLSVKTLATKWRPLNG